MDSSSAVVLKDTFVPLVFGSKVDNLNCPKTVFDKNSIPWTTNRNIYPNRKYIYLEKPPKSFYIEGQSRFQ